MPDVDGDGSGLNGGGNEEKQRTAIAPSDCIQWKPYALQGLRSLRLHDDLTLAVNAAITLQRPLLVKGEPGTGKTMLAVEVAKALGVPLLEWHIKSTTKAQQGLYDYDAVSRPARLAARRPAGARDPQLHRQGHAMAAFTSEKPAWCCSSTRSTRRTSSFQRSVARARRMEFFVYETASSSRRRSGRSCSFTFEQRKGAPRRLLRRCFFHYIRFPDKETMEKIVDVHFPGLKKALLREALEVFLRGARVPGLKRSHRPRSSSDWLKLLLAEDISPEALRSKDRKTSSRRCTARC